MPMQTPTERYAALDLGSNSFHLLLAEFRGQRMLRLHTDHAMVRLAEGLDAKRHLDPVISERALAALQRFRPVLEKLPADHIRVVGTKALRAAAASADTFLEKAESILGTPVEIISGIEEARLIYTGVMAAADEPPRPRCIIDIGGGSTELVRASETPEQLQSLYLGCVVYSKRYFADGIIGRCTVNHFHRAQRAARAKLQELQHMAAEAEVIGCSGTVKAVSRVLNGGEVADIKRGDIDQLASTVAAAEHIAELDLPHLEEERRPVFAAGLAILHAIFCELDIQRMAVSPYGIREGIVHDLAGRLHGGDRRFETVRAMMQRWQVHTNQVRRVSDTALKLLQQLRPTCPLEDRQRLRWAIQLHELGLALTHSNFRKLGAYMIKHADMAGFSKSEQEHLAYLVRNQRGRIKKPREHYGFHPNPDLLLCLRLGCIIHRDRSERSLRGINLARQGDAYRLQVERQWLDASPAIEELLYQEEQHWQSQPHPLRLLAV
ncbi:Ppx/GppA phosphatase family protein [Microbulbifer spongiae]|uniref:Ppx/GppA family phosphatase n=1 Tax=Microbulbifer spongiae TaxID=2944933 RepID=A0ABY9EDX6_9GAMM|nr:Ppx/GppA phosphatase family protein [Microbulbifer sp. MI-G]WKD50347.1 Ppx/GppA family phosphatase [Microbulbifer sp. MI-G]